MAVMVGVFVGVLALVACPAAHAYDADDTFAAIDQASADTGVSAAWLRATVRCETGGTFNPSSVGRLGELGAAQLYRKGELPRFYSRGFSDPMNPYEALEFMAQRFLEGGAHAWTCA